MKLFSATNFNTEVASVDDRGQWRFAKSTSQSEDWYSGVDRTVFPMTVEDTIQASSAKRLTQEEIDAIVEFRPSLAKEGDYILVGTGVPGGEALQCVESGIPGRWKVCDRLPSDVDLTYMDGILSIKPKCECGASKCGSSIHSNWCPASKL